MLLPTLPICQVTFAAIDFESAGAAKGKTDVPIQVGMGQWSMTAGMGEQFVSFLQSDRSIAWSAQKVHGITVADLAGAPPLVSLWPTVKQFLGTAVVVAHGKGTEKKFLRVFPGHGFGPWVDTLLLSRALWPSWKDHSLGALCTELGLAEKISALCPQRSWHDALFDACASLCLLESMIERLDLAQKAVEILLQPDQSRWFLDK